MSKGSQWWNESWNPVTGCTAVSEGCAHCYAKRIHEQYIQAFKFEKVMLHPDRLDRPGLMKKPKVVFTDSMSDLFHEKVPDEFILDVLRVIKTFNQHSYVILTKRAQRMQSFFSRLWQEDGVLWLDGPMGVNTFSLPNLWLGISAENQDRADERIPFLMSTNIEHRVVSIEPMLGPVNLEVTVKAGHGAYAYNALTGEHWPFSEGPVQGAKLDWVICGGESGRGVGRPMQIDWVRFLRDQCVSAKVPFFFKQWGEFRPATQDEEGFGIVMISAGRGYSDRRLDGVEWNEKPAGLAPAEVYRCEHGAIIKRHGQVEVQLALEVKE